MMGGRAVQWEERCRQGAHKLQEAGKHNLIAHQLCNQGYCATGERDSSVWGRKHREGLRGATGMRNGKGEAGGGGESLCAMGGEGRDRGRG